MPIDAVYQAMAFEQAVGILREGERSGEYTRGYTTSRTLSEVARRLYENNLNVEGASVLAYRAVAKRALQSMIATDLMRENTSIPLPPSAIPVTPTNRPIEDQYVSKTVIRIDNGSGGTSSAVGYITSDRPLSQDETIRRAEEHIDVVPSPGRGSKEAFALLPNGGRIIDVVIISVYRIR